MSYKEKLKIDRYVPHPLSKGWGILDATTGELIKREKYRHRIERYGCKSWAKNRCKQLNED